MEHCSGLERIYFGDGTAHLTAEDWHVLYLHVKSHSKLVALRSLTLPHSRSETAAFLDLLNDLPQLEELSSNSLCLQADLSLTLLEIFKMNSVLVSSPFVLPGRRCVLIPDLQPSHKTGIRGAGLRDLCFGSECDLPFSLLSGIPRVCPNIQSCVVAPSDPRLLSLTPCS